MKKFRFKLFIIAFMLLSIFSLNFVKFKALDNYTLRPQIIFVGSNDNFVTSYTVDLFWTYNETFDTYILDADGSYDFQNGLDFAMGSYDKYKIIATQTNLTYFSFVTSMFEIEFDINNTALEFEVNVSTSPDLVEITVSQSGISKTFTSDNFYIQLKENSGYIISPDIYINQGKLEGYQKALDDIGWVDEEPTDNYDDDSFNAGVISAYEKNTAEDTLLRFVGSILGSGLSFLLFVGTEFTLFGVNLITVVIGLLTVSLAFFIIKSVL